ncbi:HRDC domain-containing protein [Collinsella intestinalis]
MGSGSSTWPPHQPPTREELLDVPGIGEKKADAYGAAFLAAIAEYEASVR